MWALSFTAWYNSRLCLQLYKLKVVYVYCHSLPLLPFRLNSYYLCCLFIVVWGCFFKFKIPFIFWQFFCWKCTATETLLRLYYNWNDMHLHWSWINCEWCTMIYLQLCAWGCVCVQRSSLGWPALLSQHLSKTSQVCVVFVISIKTRDLIIWVSQKNEMFLKKVFWHFESLLFLMLNLTLHLSKNFSFMKNGFTSL